MQRKKSVNSLTLSLHELAKVNGSRQQTTASLSAQTLISEYIRYERIFLLTLSYIPIQIFENIFKTSNYKKHVAYSINVLTSNYVPNNMQQI